jgi:hypothetical protein
MKMSGCFVFSLIKYFLGKIMIILVNMTGIIGTLGTITQSRAG